MGGNIFLLCYLIGWLKYFQHSKATHWIISQSYVAEQFKPVFMVLWSARRDCSVPRSKMITWEPSHDFVKSSHVVTNAMTTMHIMADLGPPGR
jgi:hypothetical protein